MSLKMLDIPGFFSFYIGTIMENDEAVSHMAGCGNDPQSWKQRCPQMGSPNHPNVMDDHFSIETHGFGYPEF